VRRDGSSGKCLALNVSGCGWKKSMCHLTHPALLANVSFRLRFPSPCVSVRGSEFGSATVSRLGMPNQWATKQRVIRVIAHTRTLTRLLQTHDSHPYTKITLLVTKGTC
jgi:hypothetical protein